MVISRHSLADALLLRDSAPPNVAPTYQLQLSKLLWTFWFDAHNYRGF